MSEGYTHGQAGPAVLARRALSLSSAAYFTVHATELWAVCPADGRAFIRRLALWCLFCNSAAGTTRPRAVVTRVLFPPAAVTAASCVGYLVTAGLSALGMLRLSGRFGLDRFAQVVIMLGAPELVLEAVGFCSCFPWMVDFVVCICSLFCII